MKKLFILLTMLIVGIGSTWADVLPNAAVGTYLFQATTLTKGASDYTITKDGDGNVTISPNNNSYFGNNTGVFTGTLVIKINVPETPTAGVIFEFRTASKETSTDSQGLHLSADRILATSWTGSRRSDGNITYPASGVTNRTLTAGEHTIIFLAGSNGGYAVVDNLSYIYIRDSDLKKSNVEYEAIYIPKAYAQYITEVHYFTDAKSDSDKTTIFSECSNHMHASQQSGTTANVASGKTLILDKAVAWTSLTGTGTVLQEVNIGTTVAGILPALTLKATAGTLTYTGSDLNGTTLDGVILGGSARITTSNTVNIKNLAGNNLDNTSNNYAFVGSGTINFYGNCGLTKKADGTACNSARLGYGSNEYINIKADANVTTGGIYNTTTSNSNAYLSVESGATLTATEDIRSISVTNNGTMTGTILYGPITLGEGSTTTLSNATPFNDNYTSGSGRVTVNGDATLNLTATTSNLTKDITVAAGKILTINCNSNTVNLNVVPTFGSSSKVNFKDATINFNKDIRNLANYTFTSCTAQFTETGDEYKVGGFTITNVPSGVTIKVKRYDATTYEAVPIVNGTATISHKVGVSGLAAWLDYTFNESTKDKNTGTSGDVIKNAGNAGESGNDLTLDSNNGYQYTPSNSYNDDGTLKVMSTPYRTITWPTNYTVAVAGNVPDVENGCLVAFGTLSGGYLAILRGDASNKILLVKGKGQTTFNVITEMTAANATELSHLVVFTKNGNTFTVYLDGVQKAQVNYSETLGNGFQVGSLHGGITNTGIERVTYITDETKKAKVFAKAIRVYNYVISDDQMNKLKDEFPYVSKGGTYSRTISANSTLSATDAWLNKGTQGHVNIPVNAVKDEVTYYPDVEITTDAASTLTVNADMDTENIKFDGTGKLTIASDGEHNIHIYGSLTANGPISVKYGETNLSAVPVTIGESGSVEFDFSASDFRGVTTSTDYPITGNTSDYGNKVTGVYPNDTYHTFTITHNSTTNSYYLTVGPSVAFFQQRAINLVKPYYDGNHVGSGLGKYIISLGETSYSNFVDFGIAVMSWQTLGDCVEPTIAINQPEEGFYRFKAAARSTSDATYNWYMGGNANSIYSASTTDAQASDANTIFYLEKTGENYQLLSYFSGMYSNGTQYNDIGTKSNFTLSEGIKENNTDKLIGQYRLYNTGTSKIIAMWENDYLNALTNENDWEGWTIEPVDELPVTFKKKGLGYTTFFTPVALQIPAKTHAYVCQRKNETLTFYEITKITTKDGDNDVATIPANTAVLLYNEDAGTEGAPDLTTVSFKVTSCKDEGGNDIQINNNSLDGTLAAETMTTFRVVDEENYDIYSLRTSNSGAKVGFFKKTEGDCAGFKSWLRVEPTTGDARNFTIYFDGEEAPTGIVEALGLENDNVEIYDLNGRKLSTYKKGINIVNGKKVMVQ